MHVRLCIARCAAQHRATPTIILNLREEDFYDQRSNNEAHKNIVPQKNLELYSIIESVDSISRDGPNTPICVIHYKNCNNSVQLKVGAF